MVIADPDPTGCNWIWPFIAKSTLPPPGALPKSKNRAQEFPLPVGNARRANDMSVPPKLCAPADAYCAELADK